MSKPKIKVGQEWKTDTSPDEVKVIGYYGDLIVCHEGELEFAVIHPDRFKELLTSHDGADLAAARADNWLIWVEGMDRPDMNSLTHLELWIEDTEWQKRWTNDKPFLGDYTYRYKLKQEEPEQPQFTLFEMFRDGPSRDLLVKGESAVISEVGCYPVVDGYEIFGFTDNPDWCFITANLKTVERYDATPCDHAGRRKYAIGRRE